MPVPHLPLESLGILHLFQAVLAGRTVPGDKHQLLLGGPAWCTQGSIVVRDAKTDVAAARAVEIPAVVVLAGLRDHDARWRSVPDIILAGIVSLCVALVEFHRFASERASQNT